MAAERRERLRCAAVEFRIGIRQIAERGHVCSVQRHPRLRHRHDCETLPARRRERPAGPNPYDWRFNYVRDRISAAARTEPNRTKTVALTKGGADIALESCAIGSLFDGINFTGDWDNQLWAAVSRAYSQAIARNLKGHKQIRVFASHKSRTENTTFTSVEKPVIGPAVAKFKSRAKSMMQYIACAPIIAQNENDNAVVVKDDEPDWTMTGGGMPGTLGRATDQSSAKERTSSWIEARRSHLEGKQIEGAKEPKP